MRDRLAAQDWLTIVAERDPDGLKGDRDVDGLAQEAAFWCRYCERTDEAGKPDRAQRRQRRSPAGLRPCLAR